METPKEYYYTYYSYEEYGRGYIGSRGCKCLPEKDIKYFGSAKDKTFKPTQKIILKSDYSTREEAYADEIILQQYYKVVENPHFANRSYQTSTKFYTSRNQSSINGKKGAKKAKELGVGLYSRSKEKCVESGKKAYANGLAKLTDEQRTKNGRSGAKKAKELGVGLYARTDKFMSEHGEKMRDLKLGIHSLSSEEKAKYGAISGKTISSRKYMCTETGFIANAGNLAKYQKKRNIDITKRIRLE
jgi:hypothetical protein